MVRLAKPWKLGGGGWGNRVTELNKLPRCRSQLRRICCWERAKCNNNTRNLNKTAVLKANYNLLQAYSLTNGYNKTCVLFGRVSLKLKKVNSKYLLPYG